MVCFSFLHYTSLCISCDKNLGEFLILCFVLWALCCTFLSIKIYVCTWVDLLFVNKFVEVDNDGVNLWRSDVSKIGLVGCLFFLFVFVVGVSDGMRLMDEGNKKLVFEKLSTQFVSLGFIIRLMCFSFWIVIEVVATLKRRTPWCEVLFT